MKTLLCLLVRGYQIFISPPLHFLSGPMGGCRYLPTCSQYFIDAVKTHGSLRGSWMGLCRICRCHPWGGQGYDPVPGCERPEDKAACGVCEDEAEAEVEADDSETAEFTPKPDHNDSR